jgi:HlyD family secretion protein
MLNVEKGERVVGTELMSGTDMLRVANLDRMEVLTEVNENDIVRVKLNDSATIEVDAFPDRKFKRYRNRDCQLSDNHRLTSTRLPILK